ncbi:MAG TPA: OB-fold domain-containing protein [Acidimicrobiales bacterium]|nr:OB-fold domain-containing protein [Acidimicrobiales bacterium]
MASYDQDTTSLGVEAARRAVAGLPAPDAVVFATTAPAYADKTNATAIHAALGLDRASAAFDMVGSVRSAMGALRFALDGCHAGRTTLAVLSDIRTGLPGGNDEAGGGDAAAALLFGDEGVIADVVATSSATAEFLDRWRTPGESWSSVWEERFGETAYLPLVEAAVTDALKEAGLAVGDIDRLVVAGLHERAARGVARVVGVPKERASDELGAVLGNTGCAQPGVLLADALDRAEDGEVIMLVTLADGVEVVVFRATEKLVAFREGRPTVREQAAASMPVDYAAFLTWRGMLRREPPRRPDPERPAGPPSYRTEAWKFGFVASRCLECGTRHLPPDRVCLTCGAVDQMTPERLADVPATIATFTVDRLAFSLSPPVVVAVVDFDGGGRFQCEMADVDREQVAIGDRVEMTFRRFYTAGGVHNYFWKARPARATSGGQD